MVLRLPGVKSGVKQIETCEKTREIPDGVMVAQQVLVLLV
jgi:hypothetical protein